MSCSDFICAWRPHTIHLYHVIKRSQILFNISKKQPTQCDAILFLFIIILFKSGQRLVSLYTVLKQKRISGILFVLIWFCYVCAGSIFSIHVIPARKYALTPHVGCCNHRCQHSIHAIWYRKFSTMWAFCYCNFRFVFNELGMETL